jgi:hypothetical protein
MSLTLTYTGQLDIVTCWCGIPHAVPTELHDYQLRQHRDGKTFSIYCPLGHTYIPSGQSRSAQLEEQLERERRRAGRLAAERDQVAASLRAQRGATTRARNQRDRDRQRIAAGVCPCCNRTFQNLARHMAGQHPEYQPLGEHQ